MKKKYLVFIVLFIFSVFGCDMQSNDAPVKDPKSVKNNYSWIINNFLPWMENYSFRYSNIPRSDGFKIMEIVEEKNRKNGLEIGSSNGYSSIWIGIGMKKINGKLLTIEINKKMHHLCSSNIHKTGLDKVVKCINGDAFDVLPELNAVFDFIFIDIGKIDVQPMIIELESKMSKDAIILLHNLNYERYYSKCLDYAVSNGWEIQKIQVENGRGFFAISIKNNYFTKLLNN